MLLLFYLITIIFSPNNFIFKERFWCWKSQALFFFPQFQVFFFFFILEFLMLGWEMSSISLLSYKHNQKQQFLNEASL